MSATDLAYDNDDDDNDTPDCTLNESDFMVHTHPRSCIVSLYWICLIVPSLFIHIISFRFYPAL